MDNKIFIFLGDVIDVVWISLLWYISSLPIVTVGAASAATYHTVHTRIFKNEGYILTVFKKSFIENFKKATVIWLICLLMDAILAADFVISGMAVDQESPLAILYYPVLVCILLALMWQISITAYQARFNDTVKGVLVKSAAVAASNIGWMVFLSGFLIGLICLCRYLIFIAVVLPGGYMCIAHHVFEHIYKKIGWVKDAE